MTNPDNVVGTNGAYGGRTSVKALNDVLSWFPSAGILSGWAVSPSSGMKLSIGGIAGTRDAAIAQDNNGNRTTIDNISEAPISLTLAAAPASNARIDSIVAYVNNPPEGVSNAVDNPGACGLIAVSSTVTANPTAPNDTAIRSAITADGASGSTAFYVVLANVRVAAGTTTVTADMVTAGAGIKVGSGNIDWTTLSEQVAINDFMTLASGYTASYFNVVRVGNLVAGSFFIKKSSGNFASSQEIIATLKSKFIPNSAWVNSFCALGTGEWSRPTELGYFYANNTVYIIGSGNTNIARVTFAWGIAQAQ